MNIRQLPDGTIEIDDGSKPEGFVQEESSWEYERSEIDQYFIDECEKRAEETGEIHFLFDTKLSHFVKKKNIFHIDTLILFQYHSMKIEMASD